MKHDAKIYVAGSTGLVGSAIVRALSKAGFANLIFSPHSEYDLRNQSTVNAFFAEKRPEYVFLAAAKVGGIHANSTYPAEFIYDNIMIEANIIHAAHSYEARKLLFLGSSCIYPAKCPQPIKEEYLLTGELEPTNEAYAIAKIAGIKLCQFYRKQFGDDFISAMPTNLYGPEDNYHLENSHVLPAIIRKMHLAKLLELNDILRISKNILTYDRIELSSEDEVREYISKYGIDKADGRVVLNLWGSGTPRREFMYVDDLANCLVYLMSNYSDEVFLNVGVGHDLQIRELASIVKEVVGYTGAVKWDHSKPDGMKQKLLNIDRLKAVGWRSEVDLTQGVTITYDSFLNQDDK
jgi:GDP-L-fucose synthase